MNPRLADTSSTTSAFRLLVVEDDTNVRNFCARLLRLKGYIVETAMNGRVAVDLLRGDRYDLVLTDLQMPEMGGIELLQHLRDQFPDIDKIVFTGHGEVETARQALKLGAFDYLSKPVDAHDLELTIRQCLELRRTRQEKEQLSDLVVMYQFGQAIANSLDIESQVNQITAFLWKRFLPETLSLSMLYAEESELRLLIHKTDRGNKVHLCHLPCDTTCNEEQIVQTHMRLIGGPGTNERPLTAGAVLRTHDHPIGCLHLTRRSVQPAFDATERRLLSIFASQIAASLDNARLYQQLRDQNLETIAALAAAIDARDPYTMGHSEKVTDYAVRLARKLGMPDDRIELIRYAGLLHDIGKIGISDNILLKPGKLSEAEYTLMKSHPVIGAAIIRKVHTLHKTVQIIEGHHERMDGSGYPHGLKGQQIALETRIVAIADAFDAMTSNRSYRPAMDRQAALQILQQGKGTEWDAQLVDLFVELIQSEEASMDCSVEIPSASKAKATPRSLDRALFAMNSRNGHALCTSIRAISSDVGAS